MPGRTLPLWRHWTVLASLAIAAMAALYFFLIAPAYDDYLMFSGRFVKVFRAGSWGQPKDVDFTVRGCKNVTGRVRPDGLKSMQWESDGALLIRYTVSDYCAAPFSNGSYSISASNLILFYAISYRTSERAACMCAYDLEYRITGVPRAEYSVQARATAR